MQGVANQKLSRQAWQCCNEKDPKKEKWLFIQSSVISLLDQDLGYNYWIKVKTV